MKRLLFIGALLSAYSVFAQDSLKIDELRPPSSPGFSILGIQPTDISRPKSWREVETNVSSSFFQDNKLIIPKNFAMEFNPFFTIGTEKSKYDPAYIYRDDQHDVGKVMKYNTAISIATGEFKTFGDTSLMNPRMGIGVRTQFVDFKTTDEAKAAYEQLLFDQRNILMITFLLNERKENQPNEIVNETNIIATLKADIRATAKTQTVDTANCFAILDYLESKITEVKLADNLVESRNNYFAAVEKVIVDYTDDNKYQLPRAKVEAGLDNRYGWCIEGAAAFMLDFPTNDIAFSKVPKIGFWGTYTYRSENQHWEIAGLSRFITSKFDTLARYNNFDFGLRGMLANEKWSINAEYVQRFQFRLVEDKPVTGGENEATFRYSLDYKLAFTVNYKITDDIIVNYTFGNNLYINTELENTAQTINSNVGLVYAFGGPRVKDVVK